MRIVFVGAPGSGKSTLATSVFTALKQSGRSTELVDEFIRQDIMLHGPMTSIWEQYRTRQYQKEREDAVPEQVKYVICDSGTISPYFYASIYADPSDPRQRLVLQDMHKYLIDDLYLHRYDLIFYLPAASGTSNFLDGTRYQSDAEVRLLDQHMDLVFTKIHRRPQIHRVSLGLGGRLEEVMWKIIGDGDPDLTPDQRRHDVLTMTK